MGREWGHHIRALLGLEAYLDILQGPVSGKESSVLLYMSLWAHKDPRGWGAHSPSAEMDPKVTGGKDLLGVDTEELDKDTSC